MAGEGFRPHTAEIIYNQRAGSGKKIGEIEQAAEVLHDNGWKVGKPRKVEGRDIQKVARNVSRRKAEVLFVAGGDGTLQAAAAGLLNTGTALAPLRAGTFNVLGREFQIPSSVVRAVELLQDDESSVTRTMDAGKINGRPFINVAGIGYDAHVINKHNRDSGKLGFVWTSTSEVYRHEGGSFLMKVDGTESVVNAHQLWFGNTRKLLYPTLRSEGKCDDGVLEATILKNPLLFGNGFSSLAAVGIGAGIELASHLPKFSSIRRLTEKGIPFLSQYQQGSDFEITLLSHDGFYAQADGEVLGKGHEWKIGVVPEALNIRLPKKEIGVFSRG